MHLISHISHLFQLNLTLPHPLAFPCALYVFLLRVALCLLTNCQLVKWRSTEKSYLAVTWGPCFKMLISKVPNNNIKYNTSPKCYTYDCVSLYNKVQWIIVWWKWLFNISFRSNDKNCQTIILFEHLSTSNFGIFLFCSSLWKWLWLSRGIRIRIISVLNQAIWAMPCVLVLLIGLILGAYICF